MVPWVKSEDDIWFVYEVMEEFFRRNCRGSVLKYREKRRRRRLFFFIKICQK